jgi:hypothetical protein
MTLRAWIIEMRGRVREALCPELQVLRDRATNAEQCPLSWGEWARCAIARAEKAEAEAERLRETK